MLSDNETKVVMTVLISELKYAKTVVNATNDNSARMHVDRLENIISKLRDENMDIPSSYVDEFSATMEKKFNTKHGKYGDNWKRESLEYFQTNLLEELNGLKDVNTVMKMQDKCIDIALYAMMMYYNLGGIK